MAKKKVLVVMGSDSDFPVIHPDFHLFLYRSNVGNGFPAFFPAEHFRTQ